MIVAADLYARQTIGLAEADVCFPWQSCSSPTGWETACTFPCDRRHDCPSARPADDRAGVRDAGQIPADGFLQRADESRISCTSPRRRDGPASDAPACASRPANPCRAHFQKMARAFGLEILDGIGSTEILHIFISNRPGHAKAGSTGQLVPGYDARIVDDHGRDVSRGDRQPSYPRREHRLGLLEQARGDQADIPGRVDRHPRQVQGGRRRLLLVRRPQRRHDEGKRDVSGRATSRRFSRPIRPCSRAV